MEHLCTRCGTTFALGRSGPSPTALCPSCGLASRPMLAGARHGNRNAATLALLAAPTLLAGMALPFVSVETALSEPEVTSLLGGIAHLLGSEGVDVALGVLLAVFSVAFPVVKIAALLIATTRVVDVSVATRLRLHKGAKATGKYSLLDVLVIAVMVVALKAGSLARMEARIGTLLFGLGVLLSMVAGLLADFGHLEDA